MKAVLGFFSMWGIWNLNSGLVRLLQEQFPEVSFVSVPSKELLLENLAEAEVLAAWSIPTDTFKVGASLKWIHLGWAGVDEWVVREAGTRGILLTNSRGIGKTAVAEHVLGMILVLLRKFHLALWQQRQRIWAKGGFWDDPAGMGELEGKVVGIIGYGEIGKEIARKLTPLGVKIIAMGRDFVPSHPSEPVPGGLEAPPEQSLIRIPREKLPYLLKESDFVVLCAPLTSETWGMIGEKELNLMKETSCLINVGRGELVQQDPLLRALRGNRIGGAGLDVFWQEPLPTTHALYDLANVVITPHLAGTTSTYMPRLLDLFNENLSRLLKGEPLLNIVDPSKGY